MAVEPWSRASKTCQPVFSCFLQFLHHSILNPPPTRDAPFHCDPRLTHRVCGIFRNSKLSSVSSRMFFQFGRPSLENPCPSTTFLRAQRSSPSLPCVSTTAPSYQTFISCPLLCTRKRRERGEARNRVSSFVFAIDGQFYIDLARPPDLPHEYRVFFLSCLYSHKKRYS